MTRSTQEEKWNAKEEKMKQGKQNRKNYDQKEAEDKDEAKIIFNNTYFTFYRP
jgi:hypothetical protein